MKINLYLHDARIRWFAALLILSLLLHIIGGFLFLEHGFTTGALKLWNSLTQKLDSEERKKVQLTRIQRQEKIIKSLKNLMGKDDTDIPAQLRAKKSNFGWVMFDEPVQQQSHSQEIPTTMDGPVAEADVSKATEAEETIKNSVTQENKWIPGSDLRNFSQPQDDKKENRKSIEQDTPAKILANTQETVPPVSLKANTLDQNTPPCHPGLDPGSIQQTSVEQRIAKINAIEAQLASQHVRGANSQHEKPKRNVIALTKGFIEKIHGEEGDDLIDRDGDPNKRPSFEELKYITYESKLSWCLQASWKQNFERNTAPYSLPDGDAYIEFTIDEHGKLKEHNLLQSSGNTQLDKLLMKSMEFASPFPPIPKHFNMTSYTTGRRIHVYAHRYNL